MAMADCLAICSCGTRLAGSTFAPSSVDQVSRRSGRTALLKAPLPFGERKKRPQGMRRTSQLSRRVACNSTRAGLGDYQNKEKDSSSNFTSEDWVYLGKVFAGCTAGAGVIKYGSILLPQITQPNLVIALLIITAPVVASVVLLNAASSKSSDS